MSNILESLPDEVLENELARRKANKTRPTPRTPFTPAFSTHKDPEMKNLVSACESYLNEIVKQGQTDHLEDEEHYIFEAAMDAVYGDEIWEWINKHSS